MQRKKLKSVIICVVYKSPDCPVSCLDEYLAPKINHAFTINEDIVITRDMNCDLLKPTGVGQRITENFVIALI